MSKARILEYLGGAGGYLSACEDLPKDCSKWNCGHAKFAMISIEEASRLIESLARKIENDERP